MSFLYLLLFWIYIISIVAVFQTVVERYLWTTKTISYTFQFTKQTANANKNDQKLRAMVSNVLNIFNRDVGNIFEFQELAAGADIEKYIVFRELTDPVDYCAEAKPDENGLNFVSINISPTSPCQEYSLLHEVLHVFGMLHEHQRHDRYNYVHVNWTNIMPDRDCRFPVMTALESRTCVMGQRDKLTEGDVDKIRALYSHLID